MLNQNKIMKRIDKRELIKALQLIPTPYAEIIFTDKEPDILIKQPKNGTYAVIFAKN